MRAIAVELFAFWRNKEKKGEKLQVCARKAIAKRFVKSQKPPSKSDLIQKKTRYQDKFQANGKFSLTNSSIGFELFFFPNLIEKSRFPPMHRVLFTNLHH